MFQRRIINLFKTVSDFAVAVISQEKIITNLSKMKELWVFLLSINIQDVFPKISFRCIKFAIQVFSF